jgi:hypothetical protein
MRNQSNLVVSIQLTLKSINQVNFSDNKKVFFVFDFLWFELEMKGYLFQQQDQRLFLVIEQSLSIRMILATQNSNQKK